jgi:CheY-like chemotaxis protein
MERRRLRRPKELQPDLILLDIELPTFDGIEAARRIRERVPQSKILFVSQNRDSEWQKQLWAQVPAVTSSSQMPETSFSLLWQLFSRASGLSALACLETLSRPLTGISGR